MSVKIKLLLITLLLYALMVLPALAGGDNWGG